MNNFRIIAFFLLCFSFQTSWLCFPCENHDWHVPLKLDAVDKHQLTCDLKCQSYEILSSFRENPVLLELIAGSAD